MVVAPDRGRRSTMSQTSGARRLLAALPVTGVVAATAVGCAGQPRTPRADWQSSGSTIGSDLLRAPRGITIPPASLGIDISGGPGTRPAGAVDRAVLPARSE
jgi:hypothetical protein